MPEISTTKPTASTASVKSALLRYRVLAWITGLWLLLLVAELTLKYGFDVDALDFVPIVHGWVYFVYLIMAVDLAIKVRWSAGKIIWTALCRDDSVPVVRCRASADEEVKGAVRDLRAGVGVASCGRVTGPFVTLAPSSLRPQGSR